MPPRRPPVAAQRTRSQQDVQPLVRPHQLRGADLEPGAGETPASTPGCPRDAIRPHRDRARSPRPPPPQNPLSAQTRDANRGGQRIHTTVDGCSLGTTDPVASELVITIVALRSSAAGASKHLAPRQSSRRRHAAVAAKQLSSPSTRHPPTQTRDEAPSTRRDTSLGAGRWCHPHAQAKRAALPIWQRGTS